MRVAFIVQRYGLEINGGAELHCRWVAEHMRNHWDVEVLTTRALDYITWRNHYPQGDETINGIKVRRFPVSRTRDPARFGRIQENILENEHSQADEIRWLEEEGPYSPSLIEYIKAHRDDYDYFVFFSYRYYHSFYGIAAVPEKSVLVPTAEQDPIIRLRLFRDLFRKPRGLVYNSVEERELIQTLSRNQDIPGDVVGVGTEIPLHISGEEFRRNFYCDEDFILYIGRIDENKGCHELFDFFLRFKHETESEIKLLLVGSTVINIPFHPDIRYLGFLEEEEKFAALQEALLLCMPSFFESLSMVTLEAWALRKPVLANARCEVLRGQCLRSRAGLFYHDYPEFRESLSLLLVDSRLRQSLGGNGYSYFEKLYAWPVIEEKYLRLLERLEKGE